MLDCIVLAGGGGRRGELVEQEGVPCKALIKIKGKEMARYVLEAYRSVEEIQRIVLVGSVEELGSIAEDYSAQVVPEKETIMQNVAEANRFLNTDRPLLISSADIPLIGPGVVEDLLQKCRPFEADFFYSIVDREQNEKLFAGSKRTYVTCREGIFTGGNIFVVNPAKIEGSLSIMENFMAHRKNPFKLVALLGPVFVLRFLTKRLTLPELEKRFSELLNLKAQAVISDYPELSFDVDKPGDLEFVRRYLDKTH